jgi:non-ribosomal peptide synthetase component F
MEKHAEYWRQTLHGAVPTVIPADKHLSDAPPASGITTHIPFGEEVTVALREAARRECCLLSVFVLAAYAVVLSAWCGTEDLLVIFPSHGRHHAALRNVVGFVANMLLLRIKIKREQTFGDLLRQVKHVVAASLAHRDFDRLAEFLPEYTTEVAFNWQPTHSKTGALDHFVMLECADQLSASFELGVRSPAEQSEPATQLRVLPFPASTPGLVKFQPVLFDTPSGIHMTVMFDPNILAPATIETFARRLLSIARGVCRDSTTCLGSLLRNIDSV